MKPPVEAIVQRHVCNYLRLKYPHAIFNSDGAGNYLSKAQSGMNKVLKSGRGYPDLFVAEPVGTYHGLFIELKRDGTTIYLRNGDMTANPHIREQAEMLAELRQRGYYADFAVGSDEAYALIDEYFAGYPANSESAAGVAGSVVTDTVDTLGVSSTAGVVVEL